MRSQLRSEQAKEATGKRRRRLDGKADQDVRHLPATLAQGRAGQNRDFLATSFFFFFLFRKMRAPQDWEPPMRAPGGSALENGKG